MHSIHRSALVLGAFFFALALSGCPSAGIYRTAKTLEPGEYDIGTSFNFTRVMQGEYKIKNEETGINETIKATSLNFPNIIPEFHAHGGIVKNLELGGRVAAGSGLIELDVKYRFLNVANKKFHMAVQPAVGYFALVALEGPSVTLPIILSYDVAKWFSVTAFGYGRYLYITATDKALDILTMNALNLGGGVGLQFIFKDFYIMPSVDVAGTVANFDNSILGNMNLTTLIVGLNFGWIGGRHKQKVEDQLDRIEKKLDDRSDS